MTIRMIELAQEAGIKQGKNFVYTDWSELEGHWFSKEAFAKFAGLLTKECVQAMAPQYAGRIQPDGKQLLAALQTHFNEDTDTGEGPGAPVAAALSEETAARAEQQREEYAVLSTSLAQLEAGDVEGTKKMLAKRLLVLCPAQPQAQALGL